MDIGGMEQQKDHGKQGLSDVLLLLVREVVEAKAQLSFLNDEVARLNAVNENLIKRNNELHAVKEQADVPIS